MGKKRCSGLEHCCDETSCGESKVGHWKQGEKSNNDIGTKIANHSLQPVLFTEWLNPAGKEMGGRKMFG